jgi:hypothetical protein
MVKDDIYAFLGTPQARPLQIGQRLGHAHQKRRENPHVKIARIQNPAPSFLCGSKSRSHSVQYRGILFSFPEQCPFR